MKDAARVWDRNELCRAAGHWIDCMLICDDSHLIRSVFKSRDTRVISETGEIRTWYDRSRVYVKRMDRRWCGRPINRKCCFEIATVSLMKRCLCTKLVQSIFNQRAFICGILDGIYIARINWKQLWPRKSANYSLISLSLSSAYIWIIQI